MWFTETETLIEHVASSRAYPCPRETPFTPTHYTLPSSFYAVAQDIIIICTTRLGDPLLCALHRDDSNVARLHWNVQPIRSTASDSAAGITYHVGERDKRKQIITVSSDRLCIDSHDDPDASSIRVRNLQLKRFHPCATRSPSGAIENETPGRCIACEWSLRHSMRTHARVHACTRYALICVTDDHGERTI